MAVYRAGSHIVQIGDGACRSWVAGSPPPPPPPEPTVYRAIVSVGESNSGGQGITAELPLALRTATPRVQLLIPPGDTVFPAQAGTFQALHLGTNNNTMHDGLDPSYHAWEAGFLDHLDAVAQLEPLYYVQTGQGGSTIREHWHPSTGYALTRARARIAAAKAQFTALGVVVQWEILLTIGINDFLSGVWTPLQYREGLIQLVADIRAEIGAGTAPRVSTPRFMAYHQTNNAAYCAEHEGLDAYVANYRVVNTADLATADIHHWTGAAQRTLGPRMLALT